MGYNDAAYGGALLAAILLPLLILALTYVAIAIGLAAIFKKAGQPAWKAWVPILNFWTFAEVGGKEGWWCFIPLAGWIMPAMGVNRAFGKDSGGWHAFAILLGTIWMYVLGFGGDPYRRELIDQPAGSGQQPAYGQVQQGQQAYGQAQPQAYGQAQPQAYGQAQPQAYGQAQPQAYGQAQPQAYGQAQPQAYGQAQPQPYGQQR